jgi:hypothetical protein
VRGRELAASVALIAAIGGGWSGADPVIGASAPIPVASTRSASEVTP